MRQSPASSHGHRNRNGAGRSNGPEPTPTSSLPPHTPRHPKSGVAIDKLILSLEDEWRLGLKIRGPLWSPQKADERSTAEKVYGQVQRLFYSAAPALGSALEIFRKEAPGFPHDKRLNLLHVLLKSKTHSPVSRADTPLNKAPKSLNSIQTSSGSASRPSRLLQRFTVDEPDSQDTAVDPGSPTDVDDDDYFTPSSPTMSAVHRRAEASPRQPSPSPNPRKRPSDGSSNGSPPKLTKTLKGKQPANTNVPNTEHDFKKPTKNMARSFQYPGDTATATSSANTSFSTTWSSQQTKVESAATSFTADGTYDGPMDLQARKSSANLDSLGGHDLVAALTTAEREVFEVEKQRERDRILSQEATRESTSTYGSIDEDGLRNATHEVEADILELSGNEGASTTSRIEPAVVGASPYPDGKKSSSGPDAVPRESYNVRDIPQQHLFVDDFPDACRKIPYFVRFICQHFISTTSVNGENLLQMLQAPSTYVSSESFWATVGRISDPNKYCSSKMGSRLWQAAKRGFEGYTFKGQISFSPKSSGPVFCFTPSPIQADKSCRFQRKFGADRFLYLTAPKFDKDSSPRFNSTEIEQIRKRWREWLRHEHTFLGRRWRVFYIGPVKNSKMKTRQNDATHDKKVILFATSGYEIETIPIGVMLNWFLPFARNDHQSFCKIYARFDLGLSRTVPTLVFKPSQIERVPDIISNGEKETIDFNDPRLHWQMVPDEQVMNDGCSLISVAAAQEIWKRYREAMGIRGAQALPSAFQGRIGGAKGMWIVSGETFSKDTKNLQVWIQINDSQLKFEPHEEDLSDNAFDPLRLTFEVTNYSTAPCPSELHISFIPILVDRGVHRDTIAKMMTTRLDADRAELLDALVDSTRLYEWLHRNGTKSSGDVAWQGALPVALEEKIKFMLEAGFLPTKTAYLANAVERFIQNKQVTKESKLRTPLGKSTYLFGIADPFGVLKPGEVHVQFSSRFTDDLTEESYLHLKNMDILVARQPACRRSDIQKVHCVVHPDLEHLIDVVVFPSRGQYPLAGKLQGGDYDGDLFWLCWEPHLVDPFYNAPAPVQSLSPSTYGIKTDKRRLSEVMNPRDLGSVDGLLQEAFVFKSNPSLLGIVTVLLEKEAYRSNKVYSERLDQLCDLHDLLVDAPKQGYTFSLADFYVSQRGTAKPPNPAYKAAMEDCLKPADVDPVEKSRKQSYHHKSDNVLDYLYFDVFRAHNTETGRRLKNAHLNVDEKDNTLIFPCKNLEEMHNDVIDLELRKLRGRLAVLYCHWNAGFHKFSTTESKNAHAEECYDTYQAINPTEPSRVEVKPWLDPICGSHDFSWKIIKASVLYDLYPFQKKADFVFKMAGSELAEIKAKSFLRTRLVIAPIHANMKPKRIKAPAELDEEDEEESDDEFESALEQIVV